MTFNYNNHKINYEIIGNGKPVVIIHGLRADLTLMKACLEPVFSRRGGYKRIYIDMPGMGNSDAPLELASADAILNVLVSFIKSTVNDEHFLLIAQSYGCYLARGVLAKFQKQTDGLMMICPVGVPEQNKRNIPKLLTKFEDSDYFCRLDDVSKNSFIGFVSRADEYTYERFSSELLPGLEKANAEFISALTSNYSFSFDADGHIKQQPFSKPVLFICGRQDGIVGYDDLWNLIESYPRASFSLLDVSSHLAQIEQPEVFEALTENWLLRTEKYL